MLRSMVPWRERFPASFSRFENEMEDLLERYLGSNEEWAFARYSPPLNLSETNEEYTVAVELPGLKPEDVSVELKGGELWISGTKAEEEEEEERTFHRIERRHGEFRRSVRLPGAVKEGKTQARFEDGVLTVRVPKSEQSKPKRIPVTN